MNRPNTASRAAWLDERGGADLISDIPAEDGKIVHVFYSVSEMTKESIFGTSLFVYTCTRPLGQVF